MKQVIYFEHYPHYMGTMQATVRFTLKQFEELIEMAKRVIKNKDDDEAEELLSDRIDEIVDEQDEQVYALMEALIDFEGNSPRRPSSIMSALRKNGVWAGEWEEGSHAFATTKQKAKQAVGKIEAKHALDDW